MKNEKKMQFKNLQIILTFITFISFVLSSPINDNKEETKASIQYLETTEAVQSIDSVLKYTEFRGDDKLDAFIESGGSDNDMDIVFFVLNSMGLNVTNVFLNTAGMACSAFQTPNEKGNGYYFGRNFDWMPSEPLILINHPDNGYSSISTVNTDFINWAAEGIPLEEVLDKVLSHPEDLIKIPDDLIRLIALYTPLDGINEKGLSVSINMVYNGPINQNKPGLPHVTSLPLIRYLLNKAATVDEAIEIIKNVNLHSSLELDYHYLIADATGKSVSVEYIDNEIEVNDTKILTNFYISKNAKLNEHSDYSKDRYEIIQQMMDKYPNMSLENAADSLEAVTFKGDTQWSVIYDQLNLEATYYIKSNFKQGYHFKLLENNDDDDTIVVSDTEETTILIEEIDSDSDSDSDDETENELME